jgi:hypothetical protein
VAKGLSLRSWLASIRSFAALFVPFSFGLFSLPVFYPVFTRFNNTGADIPCAVRGAPALRRPKQWDFEENSRGSGF